MRSLLTIFLLMTFLLISAVPARAVTSCEADVNQDKAVDLTDYTLFVRNYLQTPISNARTDITRDGSVDISDYSWIVRYYFSPATNCGSTSLVVNKLSNPGFEDGTSSWGVSGANTIISDTRSGSKALHLTGGSATQHVSGTAGKTYKATAWVKIRAGTTCSGDCWGGFRVAVENWSGNTGSVETIPLTPTSRPVDTWFKESFTFVAGSNGGGDLSIRGFGGSGWKWDVIVDDIAFFEVPAQNAPPQVSTGQSATNISTLPATVRFTSQADDPDGAIRHFFWDFGDGGHSNDPAPVHSYANNGTYPVTLTVVDDGDAYAVATSSVSVGDGSNPTLNISLPTGSIYQTTTPTPKIEGSATGQITSVSWSTDRGLTGTASGTTQWSFTPDLSSMPGLHRMLIWATDTSGRVISQTRLISYQKSTPLSIRGGASGVSAPSNTELYGKFEASFSVENGQFSYPQLPYEENLPVGMKGIEKRGVSIDALFTAPSGKTYTYPAFYYQPYTRNSSAKVLLAEGIASWRVRFAPNETGTWSYALRLQDASGTSTVSDSRLRFTVTSPTTSENNGFLKVSTRDPRYFEFSNGKPFYSIGPSALAENSFGTDAELARVTGSGTNFSRTWMSGDNLSGSSWAPWTGNIDYVGNFPGVSLTNQEAYGNNIFSFVLPQKENPQKKCSFYGFQQSKSGLRVGAKYQIMVRAKSVGVIGNGGFTVRVQDNWPNSCDQFAGEPLQLPYIRGTRDWHEVRSVFTNTKLQSTGFTLLTLENTTAGSIYIDEVSLREVLSDGSLGPEVLPRSAMNVQTYFPQEESWNWDYALTAFENAGIYQKIVISEKQDYVYNNISPLGFAIDKGSEMGNVNGASMRYQRYYWRYLLARYGYSRAIHSWEYANEQAPGSLHEANELGKFMRTNDPNKHLVTTSFWCCLNGWDTAKTLYPFVDFADQHRYIGKELYGDENPTDPYTGKSMADDSAAYVIGNSRDVYENKRAGTQPIVMGEAGISKNGVILGKTDSDTTGVGYHHYIWAQLNPGGMYYLYWFRERLVERNQFSLFTPYAQFLHGKATDIVKTSIPLNNGSYRDINLQLPSGLYGTGQKDTVHGGAHFWVYHTGQNWTNPSGGQNISGNTIAFDGLPAGSYSVEWWNTWTGAVIKESLTVSSQTISLRVPSSMSVKDVAVKIYPTGGYR